MVDSMRKTSVVRARVSARVRTDRGPVTDRADRIARDNVNEVDDDGWSVRC